jgi:lipid A disaccharide synthetase
VPELVHKSVTPEAIRGHLDKLLVPSPERKAQLEAFAEIERLLGPDDAITKTAELAVRMI